ncbi:MAG TPA: hypothetical protein VMV07_22160 [Streptosporangiaceae bacterium]|nr:hypothetical protein [Streptosporangiaceae bacterium]
MATWTAADPPGPGRPTLDLAGRTLLARLTAAGSPARSMATHPGIAAVAARG